MGVAGTQERESACSGSWISSCSVVPEQTRPLLILGRAKPGKERRRTLTGADCPSIISHPLTEHRTRIFSTGRCPPRACPKYQAHSNAARLRRANLQKVKPSFFHKSSKRLPERLQHSGAPAHLSPAPAAASSTGTEAQQTEPTLQLYCSADCLLGSPQQNCKMKEWQSARPFG